MYALISFISLLCGIHSVSQDHCLSLIRQAWTAWGLDSVWLTRSAQSHTKLGVYDLLKLLIDNFIDGWFLLC